MWHGFSLPTLRFLGTFATLVVSSSMPLYIVRSAASQFRLQRGEDFLGFTFGGKKIKKKKQTCRDLSFGAFCSTPGTLFSQFLCHSQLANSLTVLANSLTRSGLVSECCTVFLQCLWQTGQSRLCKETPGTENLKLQVCKKEA